MQPHRHTKKKNNEFSNNTKPIQKIAYILILSFALTKN
ncbi:hypothetical protein RintRC_5889 [Richelia intracellularis]|nr:hypothetical protein RintRC_5889 [Richelia intracellularis]